MLSLQRSPDKIRKDFLRLPTQHAGTVCCHWHRANLWYREMVEGASILMKYFRADQEKYDAEHACKVCGKFEGSRPCSKCKSKRAMYCSAAHEERDWPNHKGICKALRSIHDLAKETGNLGLE